MNVDNRTIRGLFDRFDQFFVPSISRMNDELQLGGLGEDVDMDEISFRSVVMGDKVHWIRYLAAAERGPSFVHLYKLSTRVTASGHGGGGPLSLEELGPALRVGTKKPWFTQTAPKLTSICLKTRCCTLGWSMAFWPALKT